MPDTATPPSGEPDETSQEQVVSADDAAADVPVFANRAERRAKGKGKSSAHPHSSGKGQFPGGGRGSVQGPRQWGNRRTG